MNNGLNSHEVPDCNIRQEYIDHRLGCHCLVANSRCKTILSFLTQDGRFSVVGNIQVIHREAMTQFGFKYVETFDQLIDQIVYPIYLQKFSRKHLFLKSHTVTLQSDMTEINALQECTNIGSDYCVAFNRFDDALNKLFRKFSVLNKHLKSAKNSPKSFEITNYGTLLANLNFLMEPDETTDDDLNVVHSQLQLELTKLLARFIPSQNVPLNEFFGLLGYCGELGCEEPRSMFEFVNQTYANCSFFNDTNRSKCGNSGSVTNAYKSDQINLSQKKRVSCDNGIVKQHWRRYLISLESPNEFKPESPCTGDESDDKPGIKGCCLLYDHLFRRDNIQEILTLMKYSLDMSNPLITGHHIRDENVERNIHGRRQIYVDRQLQELILKNNNFENLNGWR